MANIVSIASVTVKVDVAYNVLATFGDVFIPAMCLEHTRVGYLCSCQVLVKIVCQLYPRRHLAA
jgi:hypothetical protein